MSTSINRPNVVVIALAILLLTFWHLSDSTTCYNWNINGINDIKSINSLQEDPQLEAQFATAAGLAKDSYGMNYGSKINLIFNVLDGNGGFEIWPLSSQIKCTDGTGNRLLANTGESGNTVITGYPGVWYLEVSRSGYKSASRSATITKDCYANVTLYPGSYDRYPLLNPPIGNSFISLRNVVK
jgi:hypothetical protein